ncbi:MAG: GtrA family protein [Clostridia bacterium]|nr:GtrA family protein [Clostridia bacterium]
MLSKDNAVLQAVKFTLFSLSAGIIQAVSFALLHDVLGIEDYWLCHIPSLVLSVIWNFTFNRKYTFKSDRPIGRQMLLVALYYAVFVPASAWWGTLLEKAGVHDWLIEIINMLVNFVTEFLFQKFVVFREPNK